MSLLLLCQNTSLYHRGYVLKCTTTQGGVISLRPRGIKIPILLLLLKQHFFTLLDHIVRAPDDMHLLFSSPFMNVMCLLMAGSY